MNKIIIELPEIPPSLNALFANNSGKGRGRFKTRAYKEWIELCRYVVPHQFTETIEGAVRATYTLVRPSKRRMDVANREKAISDLLEACGVLKDDCQIVDLRIRWATDPQVSAVKIVLEPLGQ